MLIEINPSQRFLRDIICTAVEGGIGYWARTEHVQWATDEPGAEYETATIQEMDESYDEGGDPRAGGRWFVIGAKSIELGIAKVLGPGFEVRHDIREAIHSAVVEDDAGQIDAEAADVIVQAAMFGEVVYG